MSRRNRNPISHSPQRFRGCRLASAAIVITTLTLAAGPARAQPPADLLLMPVTSGLSSPVGVTHAGDGSDRLFIVERGGDIEIFDGIQGLGTPFLDDNDLPDSFTSGGERGLLGLAFHPDYATNGYFYVNYTESATPPSSCPPGADCDWNTVIARYSVSAGNPNLADPDSEVRLLVINQDYGNHNGGNLQFGPDGYLYIGMGDGGSGGDPHCRAQNLDTLLGKMLRIDVDGGGLAPDCGRLQNYTVPADNPFRDGPGGDCDAIWSLGLRNPWRWSFDRLTGDMILGDVGQSTKEEISFEPWASDGGVNFGWKMMEGNTCYDPDPIDSDCPASTPSCFDASLTDPVIDYPRTEGTAVTGGYVYRGPRIASMRGLYFYADYGSGRIWIATPADIGAWATEQWDNTSLNISSFGEDELGELYAVHLGGTLYRFESPSAPTIFGDQFESGDTTGWSAVVP